MDYRLTWLATLIVVVVGVVIGAASALAVPGGPLRNVWAAIVTLVFIVSGFTAVIFDYSWMFNDAWRAAAQAVAVGAAVVGFVYAARARG